MESNTKIDQIVDPITLVLEEVAKEPVLPSSEDVCKLALDGLTASIEAGYMTKESATRIHRHYFPDYYSDGDDAA